MKYLLTLLPRGLTLTACWLACGVTWGQSATRQVDRDQITLPRTTSDGGRPRGSGFDATLRFINLAGVGYVGLEATLTSVAGPMPATRSLQIRIIPVDRHLPASKALRAEIPFEFEQGATTVTVLEAFPKWTISGSYRIEIAEDGVALPSYSDEVGMPYPLRSQAPASVMPHEMSLDCWVIVDKDDSAESAPPRTRRFSGYSISEVDAPTVPSRLAFAAQCGLHLA